MGHQIGRGALRERDPDELASGGCDSDDEGAEEEDEHLATYPPGAPSLLSSQYLAVQGGRRMCLGATKRYGLTPEDAFQVLALSQGILMPLSVSQPVAIPRGWVARLTVQQTGSIATHDSQTRFGPHRLLCLPLLCLARSVCLV